MFWKRYVAVLGQLLVLLMDNRARNAQLAGDLCDRFPADLSEMGCLMLQLLRRGLVNFLHEPCPLWKSLF